MDLERALARCEHYIDLQRGDEVVWTSHEMQEILVELTRMLAMQVHPDQIMRMKEELDHLRSETAHLYHVLNAAEDMAALLDHIISEEPAGLHRYKVRFMMALNQWRGLREQRVTR